MQSPLSFAIISSFQTAPHIYCANSRALSMNPIGLHITNPNGLVSGSDEPVFMTSCSDDNDTDKYLNMSNIIKNMNSSENGDGGYLDSREWSLLEINRKTDFRGRVHAGKKYIDSDIRVYVSDMDANPELCKHYILLPDSIFTEVRKSRIKKEVGDPMRVQTSGDIWLGNENKNKFVKIYVRETKK